MLRHRIQLNDMSAVDRSVENRAPIPRFGKPKVAEFRRGGDMNKFLDVVENNKAVDLGAAVCAGKSTKIPLLLSKHFGKLVIHTIPFSNSTRYLAEYLSTTDDGDKFVYMDDEFSDLPQHGVVLMTNAVFYACLCRGTLTGLSNAFLYLDEVHESDVWTAVVRSIARTIPHFRCVLRVSATLAPDSRYVPDMPGKQVVKTYDKCSVTTWSSEDRGKPWAAAMIDSNTIMAIDRIETRVRLASEYRQHGFDVRVCLADTPYEYFRESVRRLTSSDGGIVIMMVDYAHRSSMSLRGLGKLVDSCEVAVPTVVQGMPDVVYRKAYDFEVQQFLGRGGRFPGETVELWRSAEPSPKMMCDLESLECDAANLLFRMLGFRPPIELIEYDYFEGDVPIDIAAALYSDHPLRLCPSESRTGWVNGDVPLKEEKARAAYEYQLGQSKKLPRHVSCHTVLDVERPRTPPPPVPTAYRRTRVDVDALDAYRSSRDSSPSMETVFTLKSDVPDNLSVFEPDSEFAAFRKPKRVAKHIQAERAAAAAAKAEAEDATRLEQESLGVSGTITTLPDLPVDSGVVAIKSQVGAGHGTVTRRMDSISLGASKLQSALRVDRERGSGFARLADDFLGSYLYYHDMDKAPDASNYFFRGVESVLQYCEQPSAKRYSKALPESEKLYAMKLLVDLYNNSTAVAMGIQRLFQEVSGRPPEEWHSLVDHEQMVVTFEWMTTQCMDAQLRTRHCRDVMPFFMSYDLDVIPPAVQLEQRVMIEMMEKFERVAVKKDPDKASEYMRRLNERVINVGPRGTKLRAAIRDG